MKPKGSLTKNKPQGFLFFFSRVPFNSFPASLSKRTDRKRVTSPQRTLRRGLMVNFPTRLSARLMTSARSMLHPKSKDQLLPFQGGPTSPEKIKNKNKEKQRPGNTQKKNSYQKNGLPKKVERPGSQEVRVTPLSTKREPKSVACRSCIPKNNRQGLRSQIHPELELFKPYRAKRQHGQYGNPSTGAPQ